MAAKVQDWLAAGVPLVLMVEPIRRTLTVHRPQAAPAVLGESDTLDADPVVPGWRLPVGRLFAEGD